MSLGSTSDDQRMDRPPPHGGRAVALNPTRGERGQGSPPGNFLIVSRLGHWDPLYDSCVHEAGHTIVGRVLGRPVIYVRASVDGHGDSRVKHLYDADDLPVWFAGAEAERRYCELVAGGAPSTVQDGRHHLWGGKTDREGALALARQLAQEGDKPLAALINEANTRADELVGEHLEAILRFAEVLYDNGGELYGAALQAALSECAPLSPELLRDLVAELRAHPIAHWPSLVDGWCTTGVATGCELQPLVALAWVTPHVPGDLLRQDRWLALFRTAGFHVYAHPETDEPSHERNDVTVWRVARDADEVRRMSWFEQERSAHQYWRSFTNTEASPSIFRAWAPAAALLARYSVPPEWDEVVLDPAMLTEIEEIEPPGE